MNRILMAVGFVLAAVLLQACSLNPFGRQQAAPDEATKPAAEGSAAPPKRLREAEALRRFDADTDGSVTRKELDETLTADFKKEDANGDANLDAAELRALNERLRQQANISPVFDWNADGALVYAEFATQWRTLFDRADRDRDGIVSSGEIEGSGRERTPRPLPDPAFSGKDGRPPGSP